MRAGATEQSGVKASSPCPTILLMLPGLKKAWSTIYRQQESFAGETTNTENLFGVAERAAWQSEVVTLVSKWLAQAGRKTNTMLTPWQR